MNFKLYAVGLLVFICAPDRAHASRTLRTGPLSTTFFHRADLGIWGNSQAPTSVLSGVTYHVRLANLSALPQTGRIAFSNPSRNINEIGYFGNCCPANSASATIFACSPTDGQSATAGGSGALPKANWSLPADSEIVVTIGVGFTGGANLTLGAGQFNPSITITIDQDRGAVTGTITPEFVMSTPFTTCPTGGTTLTGLYGTYLNLGGLIQLHPLNGGRPF